MGRAAARAVVEKETKPAPKKVAAPKATKPKAVPSHPTWVDMISECISENKEDARRGVSRPQIKKYVEDTYGLEMDNSRAHQLSRAISSGVDKGIFVLPKGPSGRVKFAPKNKPAVESDSEEETPKPRSRAEKTKATTSRTKVAETKPAATTKKAAATTTKKTLAGKPKATTTKKTTTTSKRGTAKAAVTGTTPATKAKVAEKRAAPKKAPESTAKKPASRTTAKTYTTSRRTTRSD
ncbi:hypothetical protein BDN72DRAFT_371530 [Pluteus cervinus]|uniref:Uncharacterized protein n=1 Tax=Pluteus cervinus TaxID=181527 RepID=A0ACD3B5E1_9AGAR|nr:hypothetical protein BDN72DRAFT_371530 [Pluteus cervinus]